MSENNAEQRHIIAPPAKNLTIEEAYDYIDEGLEQIKELHGDADAILGWLDFCCQVFKDEPYGRKVVLDCLELKVSILKQKAAFEAMQAEGAEEALEEDIRDMEIDDLTRLATELAHQGKTSLARKAIDAAVEKSGSVIEEWNAEGGEIFSFENPVEFLTCINILGDELEAPSILWRAPNLADMFYVDGAIAYEEGRFRHAIEAHRHAVEYNPAACGIWMEMGECYKRLNMFEDVIDCAQRARRLAWRLTDIARAHRISAYALSEMGQYELACAHLRLAQDYEPTDKGRQELLWLSSQGFNIDLVSLEDALELVGYEAEDTCPATKEVAAAVLAMALSYTEHDEMRGDPFGEEVLQTLMLWDRETRKDYYEDVSAQLERETPAR